ncbi:MAG TPA: hypothetical protein VHF28_00040 [Nitrososphaera sp.]|nr:hypothetical protein [Nitrososphaera sp.]
MLESPAQVHIKLSRPLRHCLREWMSLKVKQQQQQLNEFFTIKGQYFKVRSAAGYPS